MASGERSREHADRILGDGPLELQVSGIRQLTPTVRAYELRASGDDPLPSWTPGAHLAVLVALDEGRTDYRYYSLAGDPARLLEGVLGAARMRNINPARIRFERIRNLPGYVAM